MLQVEGHCVHKMAAARKKRIDAIEHVSGVIRRSNENNSRCSREGEPSSTHAYTRAISKKEHMLQG